MAIEFNITADHKFFLGDDKYIDLTIFGEDSVTPLNVTGLPLEWSLRLKDSSPDPPILLKTSNPGGGITIVGVYNVDPAVNTQKVRIAFASNDTDPVITSVLETNPYTLKANKAYRHSLKRKDAGNEGILTFGSMTFRQATER